VPQPLIWLHDIFGSAQLPSQGLSRVQQHQCFNLHQVYVTKIIIPTISVFFCFGLQNGAV